MKRIGTGMGLVLALLVGTQAMASMGPVRLEVVPSQLKLMAGVPSTTYLRVGLTGLELPVHHTRPPVNLAIVLDKSGSMSGEKIVKAREAALMALERLGPEDIVSVVAYDHRVRVIVPATKLTDRSAVRRAIRSIQADGNTALFAGVSRGAAEVRKFLSRQRVNRVILLSDGLANTGPSSPHELGDLGAALAKDGISVTTIGLGLGYNEDLMTRLARRSDANHAFARTAQDLDRIFRYELGDVLSVVAQEVRVEILCPPGVRVVRSLGRDGEIFGRRASFTLNQLYADQEKYLLLELQVPAELADRSLELARVSVSFDDLLARERRELAGRARVGFTGSARVAEKSQVPHVMVSVVEQITTERSRQAVTLRDEGKVAEAQELLLENVRLAEESAAQVDEPELKEKLDNLGAINRQDADGLEDDEWQDRRKSMRKKQHETESQQTW